MEKKGKSDVCGRVINSVSQLTMQALSFDSHPSCRCATLHSYPLFTCAHNKEDRAISVSATLSLGTCPENDTAQHVRLPCTPLRDKEDCAIAVSSIFVEASRMARTVEDASFVDAGQRPPPPSALRFLRLFSWENNRRGTGGPSKCTSIRAARIDGRNGRGRPTTATRARGPFAGEVVRWFFAGGMTDLGREKEDGTGTVM